jgi:hypothetical protein
VVCRRRALVVLLLPVLLLGLRFTPQGTHALGNVQQTGRV